MPILEQKSLIDKALGKCKKVFWIVFAFSVVISVLMLAMPIYSLQILNRVLSSGSLETLTMLTVLVTGMFIALGIFHTVRGFTLTRVGKWLDDTLSSSMLAMSIASSTTRFTAYGSQNLRDLNIVKGFLSGPAIVSMFDAPSSIIFLTVIFIIHPFVGLITLAGGITLFGLALFNEFATRPPLDKANETSVNSMSHAEIATRNAEVVEAMGMGPAIIGHWSRINKEVQSLQQLASYRAGIIVSISKVVRLSLQVLVLGVGALLVLQHEMTPGAIIASSILASRTLAPFEAALNLWKQFVDFRKSLNRLRKSESYAPIRDSAMSLPAPKGHLSVEKAVFIHPSQPQKTVLKGVSFGLNAGETLGVIGPSASGKSTLAKLIIGVWKATAGIVRLDSADVYSWNRSEFGQYVGYLPQDIELFQGKVKDNIARMQPEFEDADVITAAKKAGVHEMILHLPDGYDTDIGVSGSSLSGGQRQRIALARAFYGDPKLIVLDEPNSSLDDLGEAALINAIKNAKKQKATTVIISHKQSILSVVDKILVLRDGAVESFGPAKEIIAKYAKAAQEAVMKQREIAKQEAQRKLAQENPDDSPDVSN